MVTLTLCCFLSYTINFNQRYIDVILSIMIAVIIVFILIKHICHLANTDVLSFISHSKYIKSQTAGGGSLLEGVEL